MKKSTKIWLVIFILSTIGSVFLTGYIIDSVSIGTDIYFNFSTGAYFGIALTVISIISSTVLFFRFLKTRNFSSMLFFSTVPLTVIFAGIIYFVTTINSYNAVPLQLVRAVLNVNSSNNNNYLWAAVLTIIYLVIIFITFALVCRPVKKLEKSVKRLSDGRMKDDIELGGNKQFLNIENSLNIINDRFKEKDNQLKKTNLEFEKFIPKQFLKFLGKNSITELELGNQVQKEVTTMFCGIRNTATLSKALSLEDNFNYINSYLKDISPLIRKYGGFVDKYLGDGILAVFMLPENALDCAIAIVRVIENKNKTNHLSPSMEAGISINTGEVIFGVVGEEERKSPTIISDAVNLASKMEDINKFFHSKIIFSKRTLNSLKNNFPIVYRFMGTLSLADKEYISLFECLDCYAKNTREKLEQTRAVFEQAVQYYDLGKFHNAKENFEKVLKVVREDKVSYMYFNRCEMKISGEAPLRL